MVDKTAHYLMNKGGVYYFTRHIPSDLQHHYERPRIVMCLKTSNKNAATKASQSMASKLDDFWLQMRMAEIDVPASKLLVKGKPKEVFTSSTIKLSDALVAYFDLKGQGRPANFYKAATRNIGYVIDHLGDRPLDTYSSSDAASFRDWLIDRGLSISSIRRIFGTVRAVINLTIQEQGLGCANGFSKIYLPDEEAETRQPIPIDKLIIIQNKCLEIADERRLLMALISDTGMRLSEALGLVWDDIKLEQQFPHIHLVPHSWRQLKTAGSKRLIPLVGYALEAIKIIHKQRGTCRYLFKSYTDGIKCNGNSASAALNKWMREYTEQGVVHSFRHSFRDRLREADVSMELIDQLGGWAASSIGQGYGSGHSLQKKYEAMERIVLI